MSRYYTSHAGMLQYLSREFRAAAKIEPDSGRFFAYASVLERMADDLMFADADESFGGVAAVTSEIE